MFAVFRESCKYRTTFARHAPEGHHCRMGMMIRAVVLVVLYWALWVAIGRALPYWLTVVAAVVIWPLADRYRLLTTSPKALIFIPMIVGAVGAMSGRQIHRRGA